MEHTFFYLSAFALPVVLMLIHIFVKPLDLRHFVIGITTIAVSLVYDTILGSYLKLYHYINPEVSNIYIVLGGIFIYPPLNIIYTLFMPRGKKRVISYTLFWITFMILFEYASVFSGTVVFTGWKVFPWSIVTYIFTYTWVYMFFMYLTARKLAGGAA